MSEDAAAEVGDCETASLEFKQSAKDPSKILQAICALSNDLPRHGGGDLFIGVDDRGNPVEDVNIKDQALLALTDIRDNGKIIDRPSMTVQVVTFKGKPVIRIHVNASSTPPVRLDGTIWVRPGPTTRKATRDDERVLTEKRRSADTPFDVRPLDAASIQDLDLDLFRSTVLPAFISPEVIAENGRPIDQQLSSLKICGPDNIPTVMGLLLIGIDPTEFLPGGYIQFVRYAGPTVDYPVSDAQELRSNTVDNAERLENVLRGHLHTSITATTGFREEDRPDYPLEALREVCMNAIIHRNYQTSYAPIRIAWFSDRVEITNPGGPFGQVNSTNYERVNDYRNPSLAGAMKELGYVNRFGRGIGRIQAALARNGNPPAEFTVDDSSWTVAMRSSQ